MGEKTFDQLLHERGGGVLKDSIQPSFRLPSEIITEPLMTGVRITARDENHATLWGFVASEELLKTHHTLVAIYPTLKTIVAERLAERGMLSSEASPPQFEDCLARLKVAVVKLSEASRDAEIGIKRRARLASVLDQVLGALEAEINHSR